MGTGVTCRVSQALVFFVTFFKVTRVAMKL